MSDSRRFDVDVIVAGGGSVGLAAAAALSRRGFAVTLIERGAAPASSASAAWDLRVYALSPASIRLLESLDAWPRLTAQRYSPYRAMQVWHDDPAQALHFAAAPDESLGAIVEHERLNLALWADTGDWRRLTEVGIAETQVSEEDGVHVTLDDGRQLSARLLVIADGPDSPLRAALGIDSLGWDYPQRAIVAHVATERPHDGVARQRFLPTGPLALLPLADGRSSVVWSCDTALAAELMALDESAWRLRLAGAAQQVLGAITDSTPLKSFPLRLKQVLTPAIGGAVVIGDAAHVLHPMAGQGVNLGLADVAALAATLAAARAAGRGWWRARTLAAYTRLRAPETAELLAMTDALHRGFTQSGPLVARTLGLGMAALDRAEPVKQWFAARAQG